jgi:hypothetical protein
MRYGGLSTGIGYWGHPSPLEKYTLHTTADITGPAIRWYERHYFDPDAVEWAGLCPAWARASAYESYEILPSSENNIVFRVGDKKGLLTLCHDGDIAIKENAGAVTFHLWLLHYIKEEGKVFTADLSHGEEVWFYPIYRYDMETATSGLNSSVKVTVYYATDSVLPDYMGTKERIATYTYSLERNAEGEIVSGEWTGKSVADHPDTLHFPLSQVARCPYLDCDEIRRIAQSKDDFLEGEENVPQPISPGTYNLVLLDPDEYVVEAAPGDELYIELTKVVGSKEDIALEILDGRGEPVFGVEYLDRASPLFAERLSCDNPPYTIRVTQPDYSDPNIYKLSVDRRSLSEPAAPYLPKSGEWSGFAVTNAGDTVCEDLSVVSYTEEGIPVQTVLGPASIDAGEKRLFFFDDLSWREHEHGDSRALKVVAPEADLEMVNLFARSDEAMAGFGTRLLESSRLVLADLHYTFMGSGAYMSGGVCNETYQEAPVVFRVFSARGELLDTIEETLPPGRNLGIKPGAAPFDAVEDGGWIYVVSQNGPKLSGYQYVKHRSGDTDTLETLPALPVMSSTKYLPHIPPPAPLDKWRTELTLVNPAERMNSLTFHFGRAGQDEAADRVIELAPYEKRVVDVTTEFGQLPGEAMYRSILQINGEHPFVGYYSYSPAVDRAADQASFPLLSESSFKSELVLPHVPQGVDQWWTGVCLGNPNGYPVDVTVLPYDYEGGLMEGDEKMLSLDAGAYEVFTVYDLFADLTPEVSFIKFQTEGEQSGIGGFYLYGNKKDKKGSIESLSGANM